MLKLCFLIETEDEVEEMWLHIHSVVATWIWGLDCISTVLLANLLRLVWNRKTVLRCIIHHHSESRKSGMLEYSVDSEQDG